MLTGRRTFEVADGWGGQHPWDVPVFIVTHHVPEGWPLPGSTVQFVTDGIAREATPSVQIPGMGESAVSDTEADEMEEHLRGLGCIE